MFVYDCIRKVYQITARCDIFRNIHEHDRLDHLTSKLQLILLERLTLLFFWAFDCTIVVRVLKMVNMVEHADKLDKANIHG